MKSIKYSILIVFAGLIACNKNFLQEEPTSFYSKATLYKTADLAKVGVTGVYDAVQDFFRTDRINTMWGDYGVDYGGPLWGYSQDRGELSLYVHTSANNDIRNHWRIGYQAINVANSALASIQDMDDDLFSTSSFTKESLLAEIRFLRACLYFQMVKSWGNIPLKTTETIGRSLDIYQATPAEVYDLIIEDLKFAENILPVMLGGGQATKGAAAALLGKVYLQMTGFPIEDKNKFSEAASQFKKAIDMGIYDLVPNFADVFHYEKEDNKEVIFPIKFSDGGIGEGNRFYWDMIVSTDFLAKWDTMDIRFAHTFGQYWTDTLVYNNAGVIIDTVYLKPRIDPTLVRSVYWTCYHKFYFINQNFRDGDHPTDHPLIRYADVLLGYAEALNGMNTNPPNEAYEYLNKVRTRARNGMNHNGRTDVLPDYVSGSLTKEEFIDAILQERSWEFVNENSRKDDLIRTDRIQSVLNDVDIYITSGQDGGTYRPGQNYDHGKHRFWPIPLNDIDINPELKQNPGY